jgi:kynurenine formamidase
MCVPGCRETVMGRLSRRSLFRGAGALAAGAALAPLAPVRAIAQERSFSEVIDLTHTLGPDFPTYFGEPQLEIEAMFGFDKDGFNMNRWHLVEHTGTHMDAPIHFSKDGAAAEAIDPANLVVPLAVVDVRAKAADNSDYQLSPDDISDWEAANGELPQGSCVAMNSGWAAHVGSDRFRNADGDGVMHFPGFHEEAAAMLLERAVAGIAVDTLSLDFGGSQDFATHYAWLPTGRWGLECVAGLERVPPSGAILLVGSPKVAGATGGPSRLLALV